MHYTQRIAYKNDTEGELRITLEPWANEYVIGPGQRVDILVHTDTLDGSLELQQTVHGLMIWSNLGDTDITVMSEGREIPPSDQVRDT